MSEPHFHEEQVVERVVERARPVRTRRVVRRTGPGLVGVNPAAAVLAALLVALILVLVLGYLV